ncbi:MAG: Uma2 family endonuclease [Burkholderiales bacterium]
MGSLSDAVTLKKRLFDVDEYHRLGEAGILGEDDRIELIEGELVEMAPIDGEHASIVTLLNMILARQCDASQVVHVQNPLRLDRASEPQPDLVLARFLPGSRQVPSFKDALLVIEVSDTTYNYDRKIKAPLYARAGVPELWIVDCQHRHVEVHSDAKAGNYESVVVAAETIVLTPRMANNVRVVLADLWV